MKNKFFMAVSVLIFSISLSNCITTQTYEQGFQSVAGTEWNIMFTDPVIGENRNFNIKFMNNGILAHNHPNDITPDNDFWEQNADIIYMYFNDKYSTYIGRMLSNNLIQGTATNINGITWNFELRKTR